jgi:hypothetical protein
MLLVKDLGQRQTYPLRGLDDTNSLDGAFLLQPKPGRPDGLALDKGWTAEDKTICLVSWLTVRKDPSWQAGVVMMVQTVGDRGGHF